MTVTSLEPVPGFLKLEKPKLVLKAVYRQIRLRLNGVEKPLTLVQVRYFS